MSTHIRSIKAFILFLLCSITTQAQVFISPYSYQGIGESRTESSIVGRGMGGISMTSPMANRYSIYNPATISDITTFSFETGFGTNLYRIKSIDDGVSQKFEGHNFEIPYFTLALPLNAKHKWNAAMSLFPVSDVGYQFKGGSNTPLSYKQFYSGSGSLNKFQIGSSVAVVKNFSIGANAAYMFGKETYTHTLGFPDSAYDFNSITNTSNIVGGFTFDIGLKWNLGFDTVLSNYRWQIGGVFNVPKNVGATQQIEAYTFGNGYSVSDSLAHFTSNKGNIFMPMGAGLGLQYRSGLRWTFAADVNYRQWSKMTGLDLVLGMKDYKSVSVGAQYVPILVDRETKKTPLYNLINYRIGFKYAQTQYVYNGENPKDMRLSLGASFPLPLAKEDRIYGSLIDGSKVRREVYKYTSYLDFTLELGSLGSSVNQSRTYLNAYVGVHISDIKWFRRFKLE